MPTQKGKQLHKHAKHFGWKPREVRFQAKQVFTPLKQYYMWYKFNTEMYQHNEIQYMQQYMEVHKIDAEYKTWDNYTTVMSCSMCCIKEAYQHNNKCFHK